MNLRSRTPHARRWPTALMLIAGLTVSAVPSARADDVNPNAGRDLAASCAACHGTNGRAVGGFPVLAGKDREALIAALRGFRDGTHKASVMHQHAKGYTEAEAALVADYFSRQSPTKP
ncbi:MAG: c-type cytochrome [Burkholderiales bacterium]|nr:c-type cytochrome [Burkholderiales bacterium]